MGQHLGWGVGHARHSEQPAGVAVHPLHPPRSPLALPPQHRRSTAAACCGPPLVPPTPRGSTAARCMSDAAPPAFPGVCCGRRGGADRRPRPFGPVERALHMEQEALRAHHRRSRTFSLQRTRTDESVLFAAHIFGGVASPGIVSCRKAQSVSQLFHGPAPRSPLLPKLSRYKGWGGKCTRSHVCCLGPVCGLPPARSPAPPLPV